MGKSKNRQSEIELENKSKRHERVTKSFESLKKYGDTLFNKLKDQKKDLSTLQKDKKYFSDKVDKLDDQIVNVENALYQEGKNLFDDKNIMQLQNGLNQVRNNYLNRELVPQTEKILRDINVLGYDLHLISKDLFSKNTFNPNVHDENEKRVFEVFSEDKLKPNVHHKNGALVCVIDNSTNTFTVYKINKLAESKKALWESVGEVDQRIDKLPKTALSAWQKNEGQSNSKLQGKTPEDEIAQFVSNNGGRAFPYGQSKDMKALKQKTVNYIFNDRLGELASNLIQAKEIKLRCLSVVEKALSVYNNRDDIDKDIPAERLLNILKKKKISNEETDEITNIIENIEDRYLRNHIDWIVTVFMPNLSKDAYKINGVIDSWRNDLSRFSSKHNKSSDPSEYIGHSTMDNIRRNIIRDQHYESSNPTIGDHLEQVMVNNSHGEKIDPTQNIVRSKNKTSQDNNKSQENKDRLQSIKEKMVDTIQDRRNDAPLKDVSKVIVKLIKKSTDEIESNKLKDDLKTIATAKSIIQRINDCQTEVLLAKYVLEIDRILLQYTETKHTKIVERLLGENAYAQQGNPEYASLEQRDKDYKTMNRGSSLEGALGKVNSLGRFISDLHKLFSNHDTVDLDTIAKAFETTSAKLLIKDLKGSYRKSLKNFDDDERLFEFLKKMIKEDVKIKNRGEKSDRKSFLKRMDAAQSMKELKRIVRYYKMGIGLGRGRLLGSLGVSNKLFHNARDLSVPKNMPKPNETIVLHNPNTLPPENLSPSSPQGFIGTTHNEFLAVHKALPKTNVNIEDMLEKEIREAKNVSRHRITDKDMHEFRQLKQVYEDSLKNHQGSGMSKQSLVHLKDIVDYLEALLLDPSKELLVNSVLTIENDLNGEKADEILDFIDDLEDRRVKTDGHHVTLITEAQAKQKGLFNSRPSQDSNNAPVVVMRENGDIAWNWKAAKALSAKSYDVHLLSRGVAETLKVFDKLDKLGVKQPPMVIFHDDSSASDYHDGYVDVITFNGKQWISDVISVDELPDSLVQTYEESISKKAVYKIKDEQDGKFIKSIGHVRPESKVRIDWTSSEHLPNELLSVWQNRGTQQSIHHATTNNTTGQWLDSNLGSNSKGTVLGEFFSERIGMNLSSQSRICVESGGNYLYHNKNLLEQAFSLNKKMDDTEYIEKIIKHIEESMAFDKPLQGAFRKGIAFMRKIKDMGIENPLTTQESKDLKAFMTILRSFNVINDEQMQRLTEFYSKGYISSVLTRHQKTALENLGNYQQEMTNVCEERKIDVEKNHKTSVNKIRMLLEKPPVMSNSSKDNLKSNFQNKASEVINHSVLKGQVLPKIEEKETTLKDFKAYRKELEHHSQKNDKLIVKKVDAINETKQKIKDRAGYIKDSAKKIVMTSVMDALNNWSLNRKTEVFGRHRKTGYSDDEIKENAEFVEKMLNILNDPNKTIADMMGELNNFLVNSPHKSEKGSDAYYRDRCFRVLLMRELLDVGIMALPKKSKENKHPTLTEKFMELFGKSKDGTLCRLENIKHDVEKRYKESYKESIEETLKKIQEGNNKSTTLKDRASLKRHCQRMEKRIDRDPSEKISKAKKLLKGHYTKRARCRGRCDHGKAKKHHYKEETELFNRKTHRTAPVTLFGMNVTNPDAPKQRFYDVQQLKDVMTQEIPTLLGADLQNNN